MGSEGVDVRFRHTQGDVGPFKFTGSTNVQSLKDKLLSEWPKDGPLQAETPSSAADIRLILSGKFLESNVSVDDLQRMMGEMDPDTIITLHTIVRPFTPSKAYGKGSEKDVKPGCGCSIQ
ncbi:hypothetical protein WJX73_001307 [Symbiochloris irregularis]|uniref:Ubiquitin-like domain-containing protein n=1 Tax=Symbiochloris irregularis TaxID=706552 RepID=A0AAW1NZL7_9CHLO